MVTETLFPARRRCKACGKGLGLRSSDQVLFGLYCSARCAGLATPPRTPEEAPRECRTQRAGQWAWKRRYRSVAEIPDKLRQDPSTSWYPCNSCGHLHVGHTRMGEAEQFRMFADLSTDLPDLLVKLRGKATHRQVAQVAGIRPIRIKELEEGMWQHPDALKNLTELLRTYKVRLGVALNVGANHPTQR